MLQHQFWFIKIIITILFLGILTAAQAQDLQIQIDCGLDTVESAFQQEACRIIYTVIPEDTFWESRPKSKYFQMKINNSPWVNLTPRGHLSDNVSIYSSEQRELLNLAHFFVLDTTISYENQNWLTAQIRYKVEAGKPGNATTYIFYSNLDTILIPVPSALDKSAMQYLKSTDTDLIDFVWFQFQSSVNDEVWTVLKDSYQGTLFADIAERRLLYRYNRFIRSTDPVVRAVVKEVYDRLKYSKSYVIRREIETYYDAFIK